MAEDRNVSMVRKTKEEGQRRKGNWVKRRLKTGKWYDRDGEGNLRRHMPGALVEVPEHLARANPEQFALDDGSVMPPPSQAIASAAPIPGPSAPSEPSPEEQAKVPEAAPVPSTPLSVGQTQPIEPHEGEPEPAKSEKKTLPGSAHRK